MYYVLCIISTVLLARRGFVQTAVGFESYNSC